MKCHFCSTEIPKNARSNKKYCSRLCYISTKKIRDKSNYNNVSGRYKKHKRNTELLDFYLEIDELIPISFLEKKRFVWDIFDCRKSIENSNQVAYVVGNTAYKITHINNKAFVHIWKI